MLLVWEIFGEMILLYDIDTQLHQYFAKIREDQNGMMTTSLKNILIERILNLSFWNKVNHKNNPKNKHRFNDNHIEAFEITSICEN